MVVGFMTEEAKKFDQGKTDWLILPIGGLEQIAAAFKYGETKYSRMNYAMGSGLEYSRIINACLRHVYAFAKGEKYDAETGLHPLAHAGACILMLLHLELNNGQSDDREKSVTK